MFTTRTAPFSNSVYDSERRALSAEPDLELRAEGLLHLAARAEVRGDERSAFEIYEDLSRPTSENYFTGTVARVEGRIQVLRGEGSFGDRFEVFSRSFVRQASDPALLLGMGLAAGVGSMLRFGALARLSASPATWWSRGLGARGLASTAAWVVEAPVFTGVVTGGHALLGSGHSGEGHSWGNELASSYMMLGALKLSGGLVGPWAARMARSPNMAWSAGFIRQGGLLAGLSLARSAEVAAGLRPEVSASQAWAESLGTLLHFHVSGRLSSALLGQGFAGLNHSLELRSQSFTRANAAALTDFFSPQLAVAGFPSSSLPARQRDSSFSRPGVLQMSALPKDGASGAETSRPRAAQASGDFVVREEPFLPRLAVDQLIHRKDPDFFEPETMGSQLSQRRVFTRAQRDSVEEGLRAYLNEGGLPSYALGHEKVQRYLSQLWRNSREAGTSYSPEAQAMLAEIGAARVFLNSFRFADGSHFQNSPFRRSSGLSETLGRDFYYLSDVGRETGSFKERGALVEVRKAALEGALHVVAASHGNHGLAVALAARKLGLRSTIVVPDTTPQVKVERLRALGATVVATGEQPWRGYEEARDWALRYVFERNLYLQNRFELNGVTRYVHGFEDVIPGQGVAAHEILESIENLPHVERGHLSSAAFLIPTGGGGLAAGMATVLKQALPQSRVIGVLSEEAPAMHVSLLDGRRSEVFLNEKSLCDSGIGLTIPGAKPYRLLAELLDGSLPVSDAWVGEAMRMIHHHEGLRVEGGAATGLAGVLSGRLSSLGISNGTPIVTVLTGGNVEPSRHAEVMAGREAFLPGGILDR